MKARTDVVYNRYSAVCNTRDWPRNQLARVSRERLLTYLFAVHLLFSSSAVYLIRSHLFGCCGYGLGLFKR